MTRSTTTAPSTAVEPAPRPGAGGRPAGIALMAGCVLATLGFAGVSLAMTGDEASWPTHSLWQPMYGVALAGNVLIVLGLPAILAVHGDAVRRLTLVGYVGLFAPLVTLNVAETTIEAFIKPYLASRGGFPDPIPAGLSAFEAVALLLLIVGAVCLAIAIVRARVLPVWVGVAVLLSLVCAFFLHGGAIVFVSDYLLFAALFAVGLRAARPSGPRTVR
jgi:hypothetical protein